MRAQTPRAVVEGVVTAVAPQTQPFVLSGVRLELQGSAPGFKPLSTYTDENGRYEFANLAPGSYTLEAHQSGFKSLVRQITIAAGESRQLDLQLQLEEVRQQVEVRATAPAVAEENSAPPAAQLSTPQLLTVPIHEQKIKEALPLVPGVIRTQNGTTYIKGRSENQGMLEVNSTEAVDPVTGNFAVDVPIDTIQTLDVYKAPFDTQYGGFTGGMTDVQTKSPSSQWLLSMHDLNPSIRGKQGHIVGFSQAEPRIYFSGPLWKDKLNFSESFLYELRKQNVRGLAWPHDETIKQGFNSLTSFQYIASPRHLLSVDVNLFPRRQQFANVSALVPQSASSDYGQRGYSLGLNDSYQFGSGAVLTSIFKYTRLASYAHGQGSEDMLITPDGWGGNYFNAWNRTGHQQEARENFQFPMKEWHGRHQFKVGADVIHRNFDGFSASHPVLLLRADGSLAERIDFSGDGRLAASDTGVAGYVQDHWALNPRLAFDLGVRYFGQSNGEPANFAPRAGAVYALDSGARTILRGGIGVFYDRLPLLAGGFADNPLRTVSLFDPLGTLAAPPVSYRNVCAEQTRSGPRVLPCSDLNSTASNLTWRVELDRKVRQNVTLRFGYLASRTLNTFVVDPATLEGFGPALMLWNNGRARYHEYQATVDIRTGEQSKVSVSYIHSRSRGDLNSVNELYAPFEQPVIRPNVYGNLSDDVPDRLTGLGIFRLPWSVTFSPSVDLHSGFPYSNVDVLENYVGAPNTQRFPTYFSLNWRVYRDFPLPFGIHKGHKFRFGIYSINTTGRQNPHDVFNSIVSPMFGTFTGLDKRVNGIVIEFAD